MLDQLGLLRKPETPEALKKGSQQVGEWLDLGFKLGGIHVTIGSLLGAVLVFALFLLATLLLKRLLHRFGQRNHSVNHSTLYTVERLLHYLLLVVGLLWALGVAGIPIAKMTVFAGALGVGLGFGLQAIFNNFVSGLILLFDRSLKVGDFVELASGVHGHVREIRIRATLISTNDDIDILVPNSEFVNGRVVNWTLREVARRQKIPFGVAYGSDKELVKKAALEAAAEVPFTLSLEGARAPQVWLTGFGDSTLDFKLVVWLNADATRRVGAVEAAYYWALHTALEKYAIETPLPQRVLHMRERSAQQVRDGDDSSLAGTQAVTTSSQDNDAAREVERDMARRDADKSKRAPDTNSPQNPDVAR